MTSQGLGTGLPAAAQARMAEIKASGTWGSALTVGEFTAIKAVGFEPAGQVFGAAVFNIGYPGGSSCPTYGEGGNRGYGTAVYTEISGSGSSAAFGPMVNAMYAARKKAIDRMSAECAALGGHGIVGVSLDIGPFPGGGVEFRAIGTAIRAPGGGRLRVPFTSDLSGQDFAKLIMAGVVPVCLVLGISIGVRHDDWLTRGQSRWTVGNVEIGGYTELVNRTRQDARNELMLDVSRVSADGVVIQRTDLRVGEHECHGRPGAHDHVAEVTMIGTAIARFAAERPAAERPSLAVLSLDPERRRAARAGVGRLGTAAVGDAVPDLRDAQELSHEADEEPQ